MEATSLLGLALLAQKLYSISKSARGTQGPRILGQLYLGYSLHPTSGNWLRKGVLNSWLHILGEFSLCDTKLEEPEKYWQPAPPLKTPHP